MARDSELEPPLFLLMTQFGQTIGRTDIGGETSREFESNENKDSKIGSVAVGCYIKLVDGGGLDELLSTLLEISALTLPTASIIVDGNW